MSSGVSGPHKQRLHSPARCIKPLAQSPFAGCEVVVLMPTVLSPESQPVLPPGTGSGIC